MKTFGSIRNCFAVLGFNSPQSTRKDLIKIENILCMQLFGIEIILISVYIHQEASNFEEYIDCVYLFSSLIIAFFSFAILMLEIPRHYEFINLLENTITESE